MAKGKIKFSGSENIESIKLTLLTQILAHQKTNREFMILVVSHLGGKDLSSQQEVYKERLNQNYSDVLEFLYAEFGDLPDFLKNKNIE